MGKTKDHLLVTIAGLVVGIGAVLLTAVVFDVVSNHKTGKAG